MIFNVKTNMGRFKIFVVHGTFAVGVNIGEWSKKYGRPKYSILQSFRDIKSAIKFIRAQK